MTSSLRRLRCRLFGHRWVGGYGITMPFMPIETMLVCDRPACRGRRDATRRLAR